VVVMANGRLNAVREDCETVRKVLGNGP
jgi:hypothetical protein